MDRFVKLLSLLALIAPCAVLAQQGYPNKPIRVIVTVGAGTGVDVILRKAGEALRPTLGQGFVVENRASANMVVGTDACAKAAPDGYTICGLGALSIALNPFVYKELPYDGERDFAPVFSMYVLRAGLMTKTALPVKNAKDLEAYVTARPRQTNFGTLGDYSTTDISRLWLQEHWGTQIVGIPYKGGGAVVQALVAGEVEMAFIGAYNALGPIRGGKIRIIAIEGEKRSPLLPDTPTLREVGLEGMPVGRPSWGVLVPSGTPGAIIARLNAEFNRLFETREFQDFLDTQLVEYVGGTPEDFARMLSENRVHFSEMVKKYNIPRQ
jgi:tripartite-type tricarboxylate transporter receptor subunit TctC